jgi:DUF4097 and DUF4098 domain-containing protein YvlB
MRFTYVGIHWLASTALVATLMVANSCYLTTDLVNGKLSTTAPHIAGTALRVETANGSIKVAKVDRPDVAVVAQISALTAARLAGTKISATRFGDGTLMIQCDWPGGKPESREACSFDVQIPEAVGVSLESENGDLQLADLAGAAHLLTTNGNVHIDRQAGPIKATTTNGTVAVSEAVGPVKADTANGAIKIALAPQAAGPIEASGVNTAIDLAVGPAFAGTLSLSTTNGIVSVDPSVAASDLRGDAHDMQLVFNNSDAKSSATTVNGTIHVRSASGADQPSDQKTL